jgi:cysteine desulfurase/selenocysteine lyase
MDIEKIRYDTPSCEQQIYLNNAGAALVPKQVDKAILDYLLLEEQQGGYHAQQTMAVALENVYVKIAELLNCDAHEIALTHSATEAWHLLMHSIDWQSGDVILTTPLEYNSFYLTYLQLKKRHALEIEIIPIKQGKLELDFLKSKLSNKVRLVSVAHTGSHGGVIVDAIQVGDMLRTHSCYYALDVAQTIGQIPIDVRVVQCDFLIATGRKFLRGPRGTGFIYINRERFHEVIPFFASAEHAEFDLVNDDYKLEINRASQLETWETSYALRLGLSAAVEYAQALSLKAISTRIENLSTYFYQQLLSKTKLQPISFDPHNAIISCSSPVEVGLVKNTLERRKKPIRANLWSTHSSPLMNFTQLKKLLRFSLHYYNTHAEIDETIDTLCEIINNNK